MWFFGTVIKVRGVGFIHKLLPPVVVGPVIMVIGLGLAPAAVNMALGKSGDGGIQIVPHDAALWISAVSLLVTIALSVLGKGFFRLMPIFRRHYFRLCGEFIFWGSRFHAGAAGIMDAFPNFTFPEFNINAVLFMIPVAIAPAVEHVGDILAISNVTNKDYLKKPGLHRTMTGDGVATMAAALFGVPQYHLL